MPVARDVPFDCLGVHDLPLHCYPASVNINLGEDVGVSADTALDEDTEHCLKATNVRVGNHALQFNSPAGLQQPRKKMLIGGALCIVGMIFVSQLVYCCEH